jgi:hypothetical protein
VARHHSSCIQTAAVQCHVSSANRFVHPSLRCRGASLLTAAVIAANGVSHKAEPKREEQACRDRVCWDDEYAIKRLAEVRVV